VSGKIFKLGNNQQKDFDDMKKMICQAQILALPNLKQPLEVEIDASRYPMGAILM